MMRAGVYVPPLAHAGARRRRCRPLFCPALFYLCVCDYAVMQSRSLCQGCRFVRILYSHIELVASSPAIHYVDIITDKRTQGKPISIRAIGLQR